MSNSTAPGLMLRLMLIPALATVACSQAASTSLTPPAEMNRSGLNNHTAPGSYIVDAPEGESAIRSLYGRYGIVLVRPLGNDQFEIQLNSDPGLEALKDATEGSKGAVKAIQPNFIYRAN